MVDQAAARLVELQLVPRALTGGSRLRVAHLVEQGGEQGRVVKLRVTAAAAAAAGRLHLLLALLDEPIRE